MFKKRNLNKRVRQNDAEEENESQKRQKTGDHEHNDCHSCCDSHSDGEINISKFKKNRKSNENGRLNVCSTADEKKKKEKAWDQIGSVLKNNGQEYKANRELTQNQQSLEDLNNVDIAQVELNQDAYNAELRRIEITNGIKEGTLDPTVYRGKNGYASYFDHTEEDLKRRQFNGTLGPTNQSSYMKSSSRIDYNPELCKDYFETGHCAFGDTCIFIHDRTDYANGHQLEKDWNDKQRKLHQKLMGKKFGDFGDESDEDDNISTKLEEIDDEGLPLKCKICCDYLKEPIITKCEHYFCGSCALKHFKKDKSCFICRKHTNGIFNSAVKIIQKLSKMNKQELEDYRKRFALNQDEELDQDEDHCKAESTACCSHKHPKKKKTANQNDEEIMNEFLEKQNKIKENNLKATGGGWIIP